MPSGGVSDRGALALIAVIGLRYVFWLVVGLMGVSLSRVSLSPAALDSASAVSATLEVTASWAVGAWRTETPELATRRGVSASVWVVAALFPPSIGALCRPETAGRRTEMRRSRILYRSFLYPSVGAPAVPVLWRPRAIGGSRVNNESLPLLRVRVAGRLDIAIVDCPT